MSDRGETRGGVDAESALLVRDVVKRFGATTALDHAGLELRRGERLALLGPNGAGKTTLVRCICGRAVPDAGEIKMLGRRLPPSGGRHELGFVPQEIALYPDLTARENLEAFGRFHRLRGGELRQAVDWALEWSGLADRAGDLTKTYSSGMKRRVNIACGVLHRPLILLLDERPPTSWRRRSSNAIGSSSSTTVSPSLRGRSPSSSRTRWAPNAR
jgi:ABC-2 type transport system ATP-binding protein